MKKIILKELPIEQRVLLLDRVFDLRHQGKSLMSIANEMNLYPSTVSRWLNFKRCPFGRFNYVSLEPSAELAWLVGLILGDGTIRIRKKEGYPYHVVQLQMGQNSKALIDRSIMAVESIFGKKPTVYSFNHPLSDRPHHGWEMCHKQFYEYLEPAKSGNLEAIRPLITEYRPDFLRGLYEAEGHTYFVRNKYRKIGFTNTDTVLLDYVFQSLKLYGWHPGIYKRKDMGGTSKIKDHIITRRKAVFMIVLHRQADVTEFLRVTSLRKRGDAKWGTTAS